MFLPAFRNSVFIPIESFIEYFFAGAIVFKIFWVGPVIGNAGIRSIFIASLAGRKPFISDPKMIADTEFQTVFLCSLLPHSDNVLPRSHIHGVPPIEFR